MQISSLQNSCWATWCPGRSLHLCMEPEPDPFIFKQTNRQMAAGGGGQTSPPTAIQFDQTIALAYHIQPVQCQQTIVGSMAYSWAAYPLPCLLEKCHNAGMLGAAAQHHQRKNRKQNCWVGPRHLV
eukprot:GHRR01028476.1.p1 GENE.GHRR01028476.1~~GHRR01028476.1.p1  ORF type:complete len:126 (-),score=26.52 GHRR01028476.1:297-674(-)